MNNIYVIVPLGTVLICQVIKFFVEGYINKKFDIYRLIDGSGGMPSSHSSLVSSLTTLIGLFEGFDSVYFAISLIFSMVVMYDAMNVRYETGRQAEIINLLIKDSKKSFKEKRTILKEKIGHKPIEVFGGVLLGITSSLICSYFCV